MDAISTKSNNKKAKTLNFELLYLVTGYFKTDSDIPEDKSLHLLPRRSITLDLGPPKGYRLCHTNINGVIELTAKEKVKASSIKLRNVEKKNYKINFAYRPVMPKFKSLRLLYTSTV